jgi:uncharacterized protein YbaP (TraB family)
VATQQPLLLWEVRAPQSSASPTYIVISAGFGKLPSGDIEPAIVSALEASDRLLTSVDIPKAHQKDIAWDPPSWHTKAVVPYRSVLGDSDYAKLLALMTDQGMTEADLAGRPPWLISGRIGFGRAIARGWSMENTLEGALRERNADKKPVDGLIDFDADSAVLNSFPMDVQVDALRDLFRPEAEREKLANEFHAALGACDVPRIESLVAADDVEFPNWYPRYRSAFLDRAVPMLQARIARGEHPLVILSAHSVLGSAGLLARLRAAGLDVRRTDATPTYSSPPMTAEVQADVRYAIAEAFSASVTRNGALASTRISASTVAYYAAIRDEALYGKSILTKPISVADEITVAIARHVPVDALRGMSGEQLYAYATTAGWFPISESATQSIGRVDVFGRAALAEVVTRQDDGAQAGLLVCRFEDGRWVVDLADAYRYQGAFMDHVYATSGVDRRAFVMRAVESALGRAFEARALEPLLPGSKAAPAPRQAPYEIAFARALSDPKVSAQLESYSRAWNAALERAATSKLSTQETATNLLNQLRAERLKLVAKVRAAKLPDRQAILYNAYLNSLPEAMLQVQRMIWVQDEFERTKQRPNQQAGVRTRSNTQQVAE